MAVGAQRFHPELFGDRQRGPVAVGDLRLAVWAQHRERVSDEPKAPALVASLAALARQLQRTVGARQRVLDLAEQQIALAEQRQPERVVEVKRASSVSRSIWRSRSSASGGRRGRTRRPGTTR